MKFFVYYGSDPVPSKVLKKYDLAIVEPDAFVLPAGHKLKTRFVAYLSLGEVHVSRPYFPRLQQAGALLERNADWEGAWRVDLRASEWQKIVLEELVPTLIKKGYHGVFLDTVDSASYFESQDPVKFKGSRAALISLIQDMHRRFPDLVILPNNGLDVLMSTGAAVSGVVVEDLYAGYDFASRSYVATPTAQNREKEKILDEFMKIFGKPVYVILYGTRNTDTAVKYGATQSRLKGYESSLNSIELSRPPE